MLRVYYSNRTEELLKALIERVTALRTSIYEPVHLVVPNRNMEAYLELSLARLTGVCANVHFHDARELLHRGSSLENLILTALFDDELLAHAELEPVRTYLSAGGGERHDVDRRRVQLGAELARLYAAYEDYRPELIDCWRAGLYVGDENARDVEDVATPAVDRASAL